MLLIEIPLFCQKQLKSISSSTPTETPSKSSLTLKDLTPRHNLSRQHQLTILQTILRLLKPPKRKLRLQELRSQLLKLPNQPKYRLIQPNQLNKLKMLRCPQLFKNLNLQLKHWRHQLKPLKFLSKMQNNRSNQLLRRRQKNQNLLQRQQHPYKK